VGGEQFLLRGARTGLPEQAQRGQADEDHGRDSGQREGGETPVAMSHPGRGRVIAVVGVLQRVGEHDVRLTSWISES
jgi:hypothetical protein